jgi:hypothetical protein
MKYEMNRGEFFSSKRSRPTSNEEVIWVTRGLRRFLINYYKCVTYRKNHIVRDKSVCDYFGVTKCLN